VLETTTGAFYVTTPVMLITSSASTKRPGRAVSQDPNPWRTRVNLATIYTEKDRAENARAELGEQLLFPSHDREESERLPTMLRHAVPT